MKLLKPMMKEEFDRVRKIPINYEKIEDCFKKYTHGILDVYDHCLTFEEADELLCSFEEHNLKYENRFVEFMEAIYEINKSQPVVVEFYVNELSNIDLLTILSYLDYKDKLLFIEQIRYLKDYSYMFLVEDKELINLLTRLSTRELNFATFYFTQIPVCICGNYDLSFPMFFMDGNGLSTYKDIAEKCGLHIRGVRIMEIKHEME